MCVWDGVQVLNETKAPYGGHKVKITGVMVADERGEDSKKVAPYPVHSSILDICRG